MDASMTHAYTCYRGTIRFHISRVCGDTFSWHEEIQEMTEKKVWTCWYCFRTSLAPDEFFHFKPFLREKSQTKFEIISDESCAAAPSCYRITSTCEGKWRNHLEFTCALCRLKLQWKNENAWDNNCATHFGGNGSDSSSLCPHSCHWKTPTFVTIYRLPWMPSTTISFHELHSCKFPNEIGMSETPRCDNFRPELGKRLSEPGPRTSEDNNVECDWKPWVLQMQFEALSAPKFSEKWAN